VNTSSTIFKINELAPVSLFVYNRIEHTKKTIEALRLNNLASESNLYIFSDGYKNDDDKVKVDKVRSLIKNIKGFNSVSIIERNKNLGLANSVIAGVSEIINKFGKVIVLEDDLVTSPYFLQYMNEALELYEKEEKVISIHGYVYPIKNKLPETFFIKGADCWGWAAWKRGWDLFEPDGSKLLRQLKENNLLNDFDLGGSVKNIKMLKRQIAKKNDSWAIRWHASAFIKNKLTLYPGKSLVKNIGADGGGTHVKKTNIYDSEISEKKIDLKLIRTQEDDGAKFAIKEYFDSIRPSLGSKIISFLSLLNYTFFKRGKKLLPLIKNRYWAIMAALTKK